MYPSIFKGNVPYSNPTLLLYILFNSKPNIDPILYSLSVYIMKSLLCENFSLPVIREIVILKLESSINVFKIVIKLLAL